MRTLEFATLTDFLNSWPRSGLNGIRYAEAALRYWATIKVRIQRQSG